MDVLYQSGDVPSQPHQPDRLGMVAPPALPPRVVAVEDDGDLLDLLIEVFSSDGFRVAPCRTLDTAIAALKRERADLVVTDALLRDRAEFPVARWLDEHPQPLAGIIILTGVGQAALERHAPLVARIAARVIPKPFEVDDLLQLAHTLTGWPGQP
jgi:DNA-binding response OmpR family regulator